MLVTFFVALEHAPIDVPGLLNWDNMVTDEICKVSQMVSKCRIKQYLCNYIETFALSVLSVYIHVTVQLYNSADEFFPYSLVTMSDECNCRPSALIPISVW